MPVGASGYLLDGRNREQRGRGSRVRVVEDQQLGVFILIRVQRRADIGYLPDYIFVDVECHQLIGRLDPFVEVDRLRILRPECDGDIAVEIVAKLLEHPAAIVGTAQINAVVGHAVLRHVSRRREGYPLAVRGELQIALWDFSIVRQPLDVSGSGLEQIQIRIDVLLSDVPHVAISSNTVVADPAPIVGNVEIGDRDGCIARKSSRLP